MTSSSTPSYQTFIDQPEQLAAGIAGCSKSPSYTCRYPDPKWVARPGRCGYCSEPNSFWLGTHGLGFGVCHECGQGAVEWLHLEYPRTHIVVTPVDVAAEHYGLAAMSE